MDDYQEFHLTLPDFEPQHASTCSLLLRLSDDGIAYAMVDPAQNELKALGQQKANPCKLVEFINEHFPNTLHFKEVKAALQTSKFTFVPLNMYSAEALKAYRCIISCDGGAVCISDMPRASAKNVFCVSQQLLKSIHHRFPTVKIYSQAEPMIEASLKMHLVGKYFLLQFNVNTFEALLLEDGKLVFYNMYGIESSEEFNYYLLFLTQHLSISFQTVVGVSGYTEVGGPIWQCLKKYFKNIRFAEAEAMVIMKDLFKAIPSHQQVALLSLNLCESLEES